MVKVVMGGARSGRPKRRRVVVAACLAVLCAVPALVSCDVRQRHVVLDGGTFTPLTPEDEARGTRLARTAADLLRTTDSVRLSVTTAGSGSGGAGGQKVSLLMDRDGNCTGTFDVGPMRRGELVVTGKQAYVRLSDAALDEIRASAQSRGAEARARVAQRTEFARGKFLKAPLKDSGGLAPSSSCDLDALLRNLDGDPGATKALPETTRYGRHVTPLVEKGREGGTTMYVAASGRPYILGVTGRENGRSMEMRLSDYGSPLDVHAPGAEETIVIDPNASGSGGSLFDL
ncbi:hypothetical protein [Streptomyces sp. SAS_270]|uniref:hypothetical protein n=1 Tax=Streptomyces sp. SAS_270 TaxID=3412748 RepID=UPI00403D125C